MPSNNKTITQSLGINPRFSWLASKEETEKAVQLQKEHDQRIRAQVAEMLRTGLPKLSRQEVFATKEEVQKAICSHERQERRIRALVKKMQD